MKHVLPYSLFENQTAIRTLSKEQVSWLDNCTKGTWQLNPATGLVDINGDFYCSGQNLQDFKGVRFGTVGRDFSCKNNQLTTLEGAPQEVGGGFSCAKNQLTTLEGAPQSVGGDFWCQDNQLTTLEGAPQSVEVDFYCEDNGLTSLEGAPQSVGGAFNCEGNQLTTLEGAPQSVGGSFYCYRNPVSESTLKAIFALMKKGKPYQQALEEYWPKMKDVDRVLMYKEMPSLSPEDIRKYKALATYANIKDYL